MIKQCQLNIYLLRFIPVILILMICIPAKMLYAGEETNHQEDIMTEESKYMEQEFHHKFAVGLNNIVWSLLGKKERTPEEEELMIHAAHTSRFHWSVIGTALNLQRGEWLISRVYSTLNRPEAALFHAGKCLKLTEDHNFVDCDLAYAYEAMARAYAAADNKAETEKYIMLTIEAGEKIEDEDNRSLFFDDFNSGPWYDMR